MKIALIHDHLAQGGGAEKVLQSLSQIYPQAPLYTLLYKQEYLDSYVPGKNVQASFIHNLPGGVSRYQWYMPLMPAAVESYDLQSYDLVISSSSSFAKGVITSPGCLHICYCHTPTRYLWHYGNQYIAELRLPKSLKKIVSLYITRVRGWDKIASERVDYFIANSATTQNRIKKYYGRESVIIYPPVDTNKFFISQKTNGYFLAGARFIPHKRLDIAVAAFNKLGVPLKIFGDGPDLKRIKKMARPNIEFLGRVSEPAKAEFMSRCRAFIHPQEEDFGITAVEAQASGRPVIAYNKGGARETIMDGQTGILFNEQSWEELADKVLRFLYKNEFKFNPIFIKRHAEQFNALRFKNEITKYINKILNF